VGKNPQKPQQRSIINPNHFAYLARGQKLPLSSTKNTGKNLNRGLRLLNKEPKFDRTRRALKVLKVEFLNMSIKGCMEGW
jgi:hypothetical protein